MEWQAEGTVIARRLHGENAVIIDVLTQQYGRHAGLVPGALHPNGPRCCSRGRSWICAGVRVVTIS